MIFNTIEEYDRELNEMRSRMEGMKKRMKQYPKRTGIQLNYRSFEQLYDIFSKDREDFLKMNDENEDVNVTYEE